MRNPERLHDKVFQVILLNAVAMLVNLIGFLITFLLMDSPFSLFFFIGILYNLTIYWILT